MSSPSEYLEISSNERNESPPRGGRAIPKKLVGGVVMMMAVVASIVAVSSFSRQAVRGAVEEKNALVSPRGDNDYVPPKRCTPGTYPAGKICKACPIGYSCPDGLKMIPCPRSEYQDCVGQVQCVPIPCGYEGLLDKTYPRGGYTAIRSCTKGWYRRAGMAKCKKVPAGSYGDEEALCDYIACYEGYYQPEEGKLECPVCPCGKYSNKRKQTECKACGAKEYQVNEGSHECLAIPRGFIAASYKRCNIKRCPDGHYRKSGRTYTCKPAPCGKFVPKGGSWALACLEGYYQPRTAQTKCIRIPKGYELLSSSRRCKITKCKRGHYQNEMGLDKCKPCRPGSFSDNAGSHNCDLCPCGKITKTSGRTSCSGCSAGEYQISKGQSSCAPIELGYELDSSGYKSERCIIRICEPGTYRGFGEKLKDKCLKCKKGSSVHHSGALKCPLCRCGTVAPHAGQTSCRKCGRGLYQPEKGQEKCRTVPYKRKAHPSKCSVMSYYKAPPSPICKVLRSGEFPGIKKGTVVEYVGSVSDCMEKCKNSARCQCYGYEKSTKKCYICSERSICTLTHGVYGGGSVIVYGECKRY